MKKLIIVCEEKLRHYGDFLSQLISRKDDNESEVIGIKDGSAAAQVWNEKEYSANSAQISSEQYILFIGNSKLIKEKRLHMQKKFSEYGMNYGWLGKQAVLFVDHIVSVDDYNDFYNFASEKFLKGKQDSINRLLEKKQIPMLTEEVDVAEESEPVLQEAEDEKEAPKKLLIPFNKAKDALKKVADFGTDTFNKTALGLDRVYKNKDIENQEYTCLVLMFYLDALGVFLELTEE